MKKWIIFVTICFCINYSRMNDSINQQRILCHQMFNSGIDDYLADRDYRFMRYIPAVGHSMDFAYSIKLKIMYHRLFSTDVQTQEQWDDYIIRLKENEKKLYKLYINYFKRFLIDFMIIGSLGGASIGLILSDKNDHSLHLLVYLYSVASFLRCAGCGILWWERHRIIKNDKQKPRFKTIQCPDSANAAAEEFMSIIV